MMDAEQIDAVLCVLGKFLRGTPPAVVHAAGTLLEHGGRTLQALADLQAAAAQHGVGTASDDAGDDDGPASAEVSEHDAERWGVQTTDPARDPTPDLDCEEAALQRRTPSRRAEIAADVVVYVERIAYYMELADDAVRAELQRLQTESPDGAPEVTEALANNAALPHLNSIECLPGTRPERIDPPDVVAVRASWQRAYDLMKALRAEHLFDAEDEALVLRKLGNRPEVPLA